MLFFLKVLLAAVVIAFASWLSGKKPELSGFIIALPLASLIALGEGWHNNHHANSKAWNNQERWWEFDPNAWIIRAIKE